MKIYYNTDNKLTATVTDVNGAPITNAYVTCVLVDLDGNEVSPFTEMDPQGDGTYTTTIDYYLDFEKNQRLKAQITVSIGNRHAYSEVPVQVAVDKD